MILTVVAQTLEQQFGRPLLHLDAAHLAEALHAAGDLRLSDRAMKWSVFWPVREEPTVQATYVHAVAPNVVERTLGADDARNHWARVDAHP